jgi:hypothetical protein
MVVTRFFQVWYQYAELAGPVSGVAFKFKKKR